MAVDYDYVQLSLESQLVSAMVMKRDFTYWGLDELNLEMRTLASPKLKNKV